MKGFQDELLKIKKFCGSEQYKHDMLRAKKILSAKPVILYGAGIEGSEFFNILKFCGITPLCFCDKKKTGVETRSGAAVISPKALLEPEYHGANILISSSMFLAEIEDDLKALGIPQERILPRSLCFSLCLSVSSSLELNVSFLAGFHYLLTFHALSEMINGKNDELLSGYERGYNLLADDLSRRIMIDRIKFCLTGTLITHDLLNDTYFDPELVVLSEAEVFVDCGMFTADTAEVFFRHTDNKYTHYYGFEPNGENLKTAREALMKQPNVTMSGKGLWSAETSLNFKDNYLNCSMVFAEGEKSIHVTSIDGYFVDKPHIPTFIKMDIEGSELEALKGAENIIRRHKPRLAISAYHKPEDMYALPEKIKEFRDDYTFYLRHYTNGFSDTVLYAI